MKRVKGNMAEALILSYQLAGVLVNSYYTVAYAGCYDGNEFLV
ncbi:Protein of unknown function [Leuconostoc citreum]|nr:Protein of unknown function [Leuconostoc citreum]CDX65721.1 Protein of unknown function [Leuconostoc citreum]